METALSLEREAKVPQEVAGTGSYELRTGAGERAAARHVYPDGGAEDVLEHRGAGFDRLSVRPAQLTRLRLRLDGRSIEAEPTAADIFDEGKPVPSSTSRELAGSVRSSVCAAAVRCSIRNAGRRHLSLPATPDRGAASTWTAEVCRRAMRSAQQKARSKSLDAWRENAYDLGSRRKSSS